jgi:hypothetical protein
MFEIGNSLREARLRQHLDFPELEQTTKVRAKYLRALEEEKFEQLPAPTYVKGFLRSYADALGLEGQLYVDEYNSRFVTGDDEPLVRPRRQAAQPLSQRIETRVVVLALLAIGAVFALVIAAWKFGSSTKPTVRGVSSANGPSAVARSGRPRAARARLVLTAATGTSWVQVRAGSFAGRILFQGTLEKGHVYPFSSRRLALLVSTPSSLLATVNGRAVPIPGGAHGVRLLVTPRTIVRAPKTA